jgi:hypothetical protein
MAALPTISYAAASATNACITRHVVRCGSEQNAPRESRQRRGGRGGSGSGGANHLLGGGITGVFVRVKLQALAVVGVADGLRIGVVSYAENLWRAGDAR